ncbi:MAG: insulinase family protein, partial [bacterium]
GHHLAPADPANPGGAFTVSGIVYNEMKGVFSSPESKLFYTWIQRLLPDTPYALNYAGHPDSIPDLSYEDFKRFHESHYNPSNAFFYFYGNIPTADYLAFLAPRLEGYTKHPPIPVTVRQSRWAAPASHTDTYPVGQDETLENKTFMAMTWLTGDALDPDQAVLRHVLTQVLFGHEAAPLKKALIDSQLGQDLLDCGDMELGPETVFCVGLMGSDPDKVEAFESLVLSSLTRIAEQGLPGEAVEAAFQQTAYHYLEILPMFPLHTMNRVLGAWVHGADPLTFVDMSSHLESCQRRYQADPQLFSRLILEQLVHNPHRLTTRLTPDKTWQARNDAAFAARMNAERARKSESETFQIAEKAAAVEALSGTPNSPELTALLPQLKVRDLPRKPRNIPTNVGRIQYSEVRSQKSEAKRQDPRSSNTDSGIALLRNDIFTNGVNYLQFSLDLNGLPKELWTYLPHYCDAITKLGAAGMNYETMAQRVAAATGGVSCSPSFQHHATLPGLPVLSMRFGCKALEGQMDRALEVLRDLVFEVDPRDHTRLRDILIQSRVGYRSDILENGQSYAQCHAAQYLTPVGLMDEQCHGIPQIALTAQLCDKYDQEADALMAKIERIRSFLLSPERLTISFTGSDKAFDSVQSAFRNWGRKMISDSRFQISNLQSSIFNQKSQIPSPREGLAVPIQVAHCTQGMVAPTLINPRSAALVIGTHMVRFDYFLPEIRLKGNAYGGSISYNPLAGTLFMTSFRDPHVTRTLDVFSGTPDYVRSTRWSQADIDRSIIGTAKDDERPMRPGEATGIALARHLQGVTPELRESFYEARLAVTPDAARTALLETLESGFKASPVCVLTSREKLEAANKTLGDRALTVSDVVM